MNVIFEDARSPAGDEGAAAGDAAGGVKAGQDKGAAQGVQLKVQPRGWSGATLPLQV